MWGFSDSWISSFIITQHFGKYFKKVRLRAVVICECWFYTLTHGLFRRFVTFWGEGLKYDTCYHDRRTLCNPFIIRKILGKLSFELSRRPGRPLFIARFSNPL